MVELLGEWRRRRRPACDMHPGRVWCWTVYSLTILIPVSVCLCMCVFDAGSWSNVVAELLAHDVSDELLSLAVSPLHTRIR